MCLHGSRFTGPLVLALLIAFAASGPAQDKAVSQQEKKDEGYVQAYNNFYYSLDLIKDEKYEEAIDRLSKAVEAVPGFCDARMHLGFSYYKLGKYEEARQHLEQAIEDYADYPPLKFKIDEAYYRYAQARIMEFDEQLKQVLGSQVYQIYKRGGIRRLDDIPEEMAAEIFKIERENTRMKEVRPGALVSGDIPAMYYFNLGNCYLRLQKYNDAHTAFLAAVEANPEYGEAYHNLAYLYYLAKRYQECWDYLQKAEQYGVKLNPQIVEDVKKKLNL